MDKELFIAWRKWRHARKPFESFLSGHRSSPTYDLECRLDHSVSWISALSQEVIDGAVRGDPSLRIADEQASLKESLIALEECEAPSGQKERFRSYILLMQAVLDKLGRVMSQEGK